MLDTPTLPITPLTLRGVTFAPALFSAPMAGLTHSALRRLLADYGGYGALWTEMLCVRHILTENIQTSPWLKRRPQEGKVIYQLLMSSADRLPEILDRLAALRPDGIDLNMACPAPGIRRQGGGADLFEDEARLREILRVVRAHFTGPLLIKTRLGRETPAWRQIFRDRLRLLEDEGVDALTLHPRFAEEKLKRSARHALYGELAASTRLPVIASGDLVGREQAESLAGHLAPTAGLMFGRIIAAQPWFFAKWQNPALVVDYLDAWNRLCDYISEDFPEVKALERIKQITPYFARNLYFGHTFFAKVESALDLATARARASEFLAQDPQIDPRVAVNGI